MGTFSKLCDIIMEASASNYTAKRNNAIKKQTPHHVAGCLTAKQIGAIFQNPNRKASANYGIGIDGKIVGIVPEESRAWTSSSPSNDHQAITIEVSNDQVGGDWHISDLCIERLIDLMTDVRKRTGSMPYIYDGTVNGTITRHNMFTATSCPGPYLQSKLQYITEQVNKRLTEGTAPVEVPTIQAPVTGRKVGDKVTISGIYVASNSTNRLNPARTSGTITKIVAGAKNPYLLDKGNLGWTNDGCIIDSAMTAPTTNTTTNTYTVQSGDYLSIIGSKLGVNWKEIASLNGIHSPYTIYKGQKLKIPTAISETKTNRKSNEEICKEVWAGKWGNGGNRMYNLKQAGYDAELIQSMVNRGIGK